MGVGVWGRERGFEVVEDPDVMVKAGFVDVDGGKWWNWKRALGFSGERGDDRDDCFGVGG